MKKNIYKLLKLYESFSDLFDDDILVDDEKNSGFIDNELSNKIASNDLKPIIIDLLGVDKPRGWKYEKDENNNEILTHKGHATNYIDSSTQDIVITLKSKGFKLYEASNNIYAFINGLGYINGLKAKGYNIPPTTSPQYEYYKRNEEKYNNWLSNIYPNMPEIVQDIFKTNIKCEKVVLSNDEGIIMLILKEKTSVDRYFYRYDAIIKLTGKVIYDEKDDKEYVDIIKNAKDKNNRISFLKLRYKKIVGTGINQFIKYFDLDKNKEPYGIIYFNWNKSINCAKMSKQYKIPVFLLWLLQKGIYPLNDLEKEDDNADYELTDNGLTFDFYKNIDTTKANNDNKASSPVTLKNAIPDSCITIRLSDYQLEHFHDIFD